MQSTHYAIGTPRGASRIEPSDDSVLRQEELQAGFAVAVAKCHVSEEVAAARTQTASFVVQQGEAHVHTAHQYNELSYERFNVVSVALEQRCVEHREFELQAMRCYQQGVT